MVEDASVRSARLSKYFNLIIHGKRALNSATDGNRFIEALCDQNDRSRSAEVLIASNCGLASLGRCLRLSSDTAFLIGPASDAILFFSDPTLKQLFNGQFLLSIVRTITDPPAFWDSLVAAHHAKVLDEKATQAFAWLLLEQLTGRKDGLPDVRDTAETVTKDASLIDSPWLSVRLLGQKIKHVLRTTSTSIDPHGVAGPGGRNDNDHLDFREIAILPTADEISSKEPAFYRQADAIQSVEPEKRGAIHLDNQFRLLREDMLDELREDLRIATAQKKKSRRALIVRDLELYGTHSGTQARRLPCGLALRCRQDIPQLAMFKSAAERKAYLTKNSKFMKHRSFGCLINGNDVVAFANVERDLDLLAKSPPVIVLQIRDTCAFERALLATKSPQPLWFVQVDTAVFAYEPILKCLQNMTEIPLHEDLLHSGSDDDHGQSTIQPFSLVEKIQNSRNDDLQDVLKTPRSVKLDGSQTKSLMSGLTRRVSLIQGPPGTGKSFIGALLLKALHDYTSETILVLSYTNHALDQFTEDALDMGIPAASIVRLGSKYTPRTKSLNISEQKSAFRTSPQTNHIIQVQKSESEGFHEELARSMSDYRNFQLGKKELMEYLEFSEDSQYFDAFTVPEEEDGMTKVGKGGHKIDEFYLFDQWISGSDAGVYEPSASHTYPEIWQMNKEIRASCLSRWTSELVKERVSTVGLLKQQYDQCQARLAELFREKTTHIIKSKRIIACTTTGAAMHVEELQNASPGIVLVEEAGEILESHILTAMAPNTKQLVLIGDHKQLRPKVNNFKLTVEKGEGYNLNMSMFERLVHSGVPHTTLSKQHRMCPEISSFVRNLTYPELEDAPTTLDRPSLRGFQDRVIFVNHDCPELNAERIAERRDEGANMSKENEHEVNMVWKCVRYLAQQGYGTDKLVVLTPYLGQLHLLRNKLMEENDPILNDLDSYDLVRAGLLTPSAAGVSKRPIKMSTIDNYQGEESDIVIVSLTRSNQVGEIGFMSAPQRVNVLLSRARDALIMIGNANTFMTSRKGKDVWGPLMAQLKVDGHIYDGFPVKCERHPDRTTTLRSPQEFESECPDGGCSEPCGTLLSCEVHYCPSKCHQLSDHSKQECMEPVTSVCPQNHAITRPCHQKNSAKCEACEAEAREKEEKHRRDRELEAQRKAKQKAYERELAEIQAEIEHERRKLRDRAEDQERLNVIMQQREDLARAKQLGSQPIPIRLKSPPPQPTPNVSMPSAPAPVGISSDRNRPAPSPKQNNASASNSQWKPTPAKNDWEYQKKLEGAKNEALDTLMDMIGLEDVKEQFLSLKAKVDTVVRQGISLKDERLGAAFLGNPGTGKTTVARLYGKFLASVGALPGDSFVETSGSGLAHDGIDGCKKYINAILNAKGGVFFIDEAYQLVSGNSPGGKAVLDYLLAEIENLTGKVVFVLAGYNKQMEDFFGHNPGIPSRIPYQLQFRDYEDDELLNILCYAINKKYNGAMALEDGMRGLYARIVACRIGRGRGRDGFGNARAVHNKLAQVTERQARRLKKERRAGKRPDDLLLTKEDLIGPDPSAALKNNGAWTKLQELIGLKTVKDAVQILLDGIQFNYQRELEEKPLIEYSLNRVFLGSPGTGKTTVAKLYGQILADLGLLSNGEVVIKNPSDFVGNVIGGSEANTKAILASTLGKVLVIDEAYMLAGSRGSHSTSANPDQFKTAVIDTLVAEVQSVPGDDRCVLLLGYTDEMEEMIRDVNPGLSRRFPLDSAFVFEDFSNSELRQILDLKLKTQCFQATDQAKKVAMDMLRRARNRPHFGNGGEIDILLDKAKALHQKHMSSRKCKYRDQFEAHDFDEDFDRGARATTNCELLFKGVIGCDHIVKQLQKYQNTVRNMEALGMDPRDEIPFNFIFRGPPGTGKTTTARRMGKIYYDMGFLANADLEEASATDLVGQYIGHTGPKVQKLLEKSLGKVLFIDEAYRLAEGHFATEAMDELVDCLTKPKYAKKMIVILAGYDQDMNRLMSMNPGLTSRFPDAITFNHLSPQECFQLLSDVLGKKKQLGIAALRHPNESFRHEVLQDFKELTRLPAWGNGRDVQTIATSIFRDLMGTSVAPGTPLVVAEDMVRRAMQEMLGERSSRAQNVNSSRHGVRPRQPMPPPQANSSTPPQSNTATQSNTGKQSNTDATQSNTATQGSKKPNMPPAQTPQTQPEKPATQASPALPTVDSRDAGVSDDIWQQLQRDKAEADAREQAYAELQKEARKKQEAAKKAEAELEDAKRAEQAAADEEERRRREIERIKHELARRAKEAEAAELERRRKEAEEKRKQEEKAQAKLRTMGVCVQGFRWLKQENGYRCAGGAHFVSDAALGL